MNILTQITAQPSVSCIKSLHPDSQDKVHFKHAMARRLLELNPKLDYSFDIKILTLSRGMAQRLLLNSGSGLGNRQMKHNCTRWKHAVTSAFQEKQWKRPNRPFQLGTFVGKENVCVHKPRKETNTKVLFLGTYVF